MSSDSNSRDIKHALYGCKAMTSTDGGRVHQCGKPIYPKGDNQELCRRCWVLHKCEYNDDCPNIHIVDSNYCEYHNAL